MVKLKACPRCRGDLNVTQDQYGPFTECLQCGYTRDLESPVPTKLNSYRKAFYDKHVA